MLFWTLLIGSAFAAWAMLRTLGGEREWRLRELEHRLAHERANERRRQEQIAEVAGRINPGQAPQHQSPQHHAPHPHRRAA